MNWIKKIARPLILIVLPAVIIACSVSYKFNGSSINYDKVKTISIADFPIKSEYVYAPLATKFNEDLKDIFIRQTRLQLLKPNQNADLQIDGEITGYNQYNQAVSADGYSSETKLTSRSMYALSTTQITPKTSNNNSQLSVPMIPASC